MRSIDMENHYFSKAFYNYLNGRKAYPYFDKNLGVVHREGVISPAFDKPLYNPPYTCFEEGSDIDAIRLDVMEKCGIECASISAMAGMEEIPEKEECIRVAKETNDEVAAAVKKHPDRFFGSFCLPTPYVEESLEEMDRAVNVLGLKYWHTHSSFLGQGLYEKKFEPIFAKLSGLGGAFYVHPGYPAVQYLLDSGPAFSTAGFGFGVDTMKTTIRLFMNGIFDRYPNLTMILGHMGEFYPFLIDRMDNRFDFFRTTGSDPFNHMKHKFEYYFKNHNIMMTTSGIFDPDVVMLTIKKFGIDSIMFGADYPAEDFGACLKFVESLPISKEDKEKIFYKNAEKYIFKI